MRRVKNLEHTLVLKRQMRTAQNLEHAQLCVAPTSLSMMRLKQSSQRNLNSVRSLLAR
jgi:hypothetical protein